MRSPIVFSGAIDVCFFASSLSANVKALARRHLFALGRGRCRGGSEARSTRSHFTRAVRRRDRRYRGGLRLAASFGVRTSFHRCRWDAQLSSSARLGFLACAREPARVSRACRRGRRHLRRSRHAHCAAIVLPSQVISRQAGRRAGRRGWVLALASCPIGLMPRFVLGRHAGARHSNATRRRRARIQIDYMNRRAGQPPRAANLLAEAVRSLLGPADSS